MIKPAAILIGVTFLLSSSGLKAQTQTFDLYSFESGNQGWRVDSGVPVPAPTLVIDGMLGVTDGSQSARLSAVEPGFKFDVLGTGQIQSGNSLFSDWDAIAGLVAASDPSNEVRLNFDIAFDYGNVLGNSGFQMGMFVNSGAGFKQYRTSPGGVGQFLAGTTGGPLSLGPEAMNSGVGLTTLSSNQYRLSVPLGGVGAILDFAPGTGYQVGFNSNGNWIGDLDLAIDNVNVTSTPITPPVFSEEVFFSWETPDNPGTPGVNEQFEGWNDGDIDTTYLHTRSISSTGATDGSSALALTVESGDSGFAWGSQFILDSSTATGDPANQAAIDSLVDKINAADRIAFDVTFPDTPADLLPQTLQMNLHIGDETANFYRPVPPVVVGNTTDDAGTTVTVEYLLSEFRDPQAGTFLTTEGLVKGERFSMALATNNVNGPVNIFVDNLRLLTEVDDAADFNEDGNVDGLDFLIWQRGESPNPLSATDLDNWQAAYGDVALVGSVSSVPEPSTLLATLVLVLGVASTRFRTQIAG